jgi:SAM-dependent methyltransferase
MESEDEALRLDLKTDPKAIRRQATWAGLKSGMRVADLGCGPGKTSFVLNEIVQPNGSTVGVDISSQRIDYAVSHYQASGLTFVKEDIRKPLESLGTFDFIWIRFVLEHYKFGSFEIVKQCASLLNPGGVACLIDLDHNCLNHFGLPDRLENTILGIIHALDQSSNFDPYAGRKLFSFLYDLRFDEIDVTMEPHHVIFGKLSEVDEYNWRKKVVIAAKNSGYAFGEYEEGFDGFLAEFEEYFSNPRRFTYTPIICVRGRTPF